MDFALGCIIAFVTDASLLQIYPFAGKCSLI